MFTLKDIDHAQKLFDAMLQHPSHNKERAKEFFPRYEAWMKECKKLSEAKMAELDFKDKSAGELKVIVGEKLAKVKEIEEEYTKDCEAIGELKAEATAEEREERQQKKTAAYIKRNASLKANDEKYTEYLNAEKQKIQNKFLEETSIEIEPFILNFNPDMIMSIQFALARNPVIELIR